MLFNIIFLICVTIPLMSQSLKEKIADLSLLAISSQQSHIHYELAMAYCKDQELDRAFISFLDALQIDERISTVDSAESETYYEALGDYLNGGDPCRLAQELIEKYGERAQSNPEDVYLNVLISMAYANLGKYAIFFERFYSNYPALRHHFLADKARGILYLKLLQRESDHEERALLQEQAHLFLSRALEKCPLDPSLYKTLIFLSKDAKNSEAIVSLLRKLIDHRVKFVRGDIYSYVQEASLLGELEVAQQIIDQAKSYYNYSRAISDAEDFLNRYKDLSR